MPLEEVLPLTLFQPTLSLEDFMDDLDAGSMLGESTTKLQTKSVVMELFNQEKIAMEEFAALLLASSLLPPLSAELLLETAMLPKSALELLPIAQLMLWSLPTLLAENSLELAMFN